MRRHRAVAPVFFAALLLAACGGGSKGTNAGGNTTTAAPAASTTAAAKAVSKVEGGAFGFSITVSLFNGPPATKEAQPSVTLPAGGSATPVTATAPSLAGKFGPATFFTAGQTDVSTQGTPAGGSVTSSAKLTAITNDQAEVLVATTLTSTCTADATGARGSTTLTGGKLDVDGGLDANANGSYTDPGDHAPVNVSLDASPAANKSYDAHIHVNGSQDNFRYVFNEQTPATGAITINAAHMYLLGPTAKGDLLVGQVRCTATP